VAGLLPVLDSLLKHWIVVIVLICLYSIEIVLHQGCLSSDGRAQWLCMSARTLYRLPCRYRLTPVKDMPVPTDRNKQDQREQKKYSPSASYPQLSLEAIDLQHYVFLSLIPSIHILTSHE
jgi:hypothetical protein